MLTEGGNVFKDADGQPLTRRINQDEVMPTVQWLEQITGLDFTTEKSPEDKLPARWLGSTGRKPTSGDLDLQVDVDEITKDQLVAKLQAWAAQQGTDASRYMKKSGISVHFLTAIRGDPRNGFVQTDFMFTGNPRWNQFVLQSDPNSDFKGASRNILINSIAKSLGYKLNQNDGIADRATNKIITDDPDRVAPLLLNPRATVRDLYSVERIMAALKNDPKRDAKLADFRDHMQRAGTPLDESAAVYTEYNEVSIMARLRDRIVNQGMQVIVEQEQPLRKDPRIPHPEDFVFMEGSQGAAKAVQGLEYAGQNAGDITIKWDGKPALIFGRLPDGSLSVMDKYMFDSGYAARSPADWQRYDQQKASGNMRPDLYPRIAAIWPLLDAATKGPGFFWGDLMWTGKLEPQDGFYRFQPNEVAYAIPVTTNTKKTIGNARAGVAVHQHFENLADKTARTWNGQGLADVPGGVAILRPSFGNRFQLQPPNLQAARSAIKQYGESVDELLDSLPASTRARIQTYFNQRITGGTTLSLHNWLKGNGVSAKQYRELVTGTPDEQGQYSAATNNGPGKLFTLAGDNTVVPSEAYTGLLTIWDAVYQAKLAMAQQLESQVRGLEQRTRGQAEGEGFVINTPHGLVKLVNRGVFSAANRARNNPQT